MEIRYGVGDKILYHLKAVDNMVSGKYQSFVTCEIDTTNRCQLDCKWCIYKKVREKKPIDLDMIIFQRMIQFLYLSGCKSVTFTGGGEPLLHPMIKEMIAYIRLRNMKVGIVTNGVALHRIEDVLKHIDFVRISLDCATAERFRKLKGRDKFEMIYHNIRKIVKLAECDVGLSMVHTQENEDQIGDFIQLGKDLNVDYTQIKAAWEPSNIEKQTPLMQYSDIFVTERYSVTPKKSISNCYLPCQIAGLIGQLGADGKLYYCCVHRGKDEWAIGNVNKQDIHDLIKKRKEMLVDFSKCGSCRYLNYAKVYQQVTDKKYTMLRHREFI